jgi:protoporphyrinogen IX oxidase
MASYYEWFKVIHIISVISWMAGLLYLPRIYVYHTRVEAGSDADKIFKIMEIRLLRFIMNPAMIATFTFGLILAYIYGMQALGGWFHIKMLCIAFMAIFHGLLARWRKDFDKGQNNKSENFYRFMNEVPTILMIISVIMVIIKPFE